MKSALNYAKFFIKKGIDTNPNTYDGNMKLQKMLFFANYLSVVMHGNCLFPEPIRAVSHGCVVEEVRLRYRNDYYTLYKESMAFDPDMTQNEYDVLNATIDIFGDLSAKELSELNHTFDFWKVAHQRSDTSYGHNKVKGIVPAEDMLKEADRLKAVVDAYRQTKAMRAMREVINGVTFYYDDSVEMNDDTLEQLVAFSEHADEDAYTVYAEEGRLVIY